MDPLTVLRPLRAASTCAGGAPMVPAMELALAANFGGAARWRDEFAACARALGTGPGWALLVFQPHDGRLVNRGAPEAVAALGDGVPLVAYEATAAAGAADITAFTASIDWAAAYARYQAAVHAASEPFGASAADAAGAVLLDVRRAGVYEQATTTIAGAHWRDPAFVAQWAGELPVDRPVLVSCIYGHEVGRATALRLRAFGVQARFLRGGIDGWQAAGLPLQAKADADAPRAA